MSTGDTIPAMKHVPRLVLSHQVHGRVHGKGAVGRFNTWLAVNITRKVGTMWAAYGFALIALVSLPASLMALARGDTVTFIIWISQSLLQLVLLPIIIVGQNVIQTANDERARADHETLSAVHELTVHVHAINEAQTEILKQLRTNGRPQPSSSLVGERYVPPRRNRNAPSESMSHGN